ncbi:hypothetical protein BX666DRAFT_2023509 [Dichotomocladium elegans]|nr:hypothetical protein BX666DRAFT_2023509 [Dichotomocladium elegans]
MSLEPAKKPRPLLEALPLEILSIVFSKLVTKDRVLCLDVSPEWRAFLLAWPDMWREITTEDHFNIGLGLLPYRASIQSDAVHELHFDCSEISSWYKPGEPDTTRVIDFLLAQECFQLQKVFMRAAFESEDTFSKFVFLTGRATITDLELDCKDCEIAAMLVLDAVLHHYPRLVRCALKTHRDWPANRTRLFKDLQPHQHLRDLKIHLSGYRPLPVDIIIQYTPKLQHITSASLVCEDVDPTLRLLITSCPEIQTIHLGGALEQSWRSPALRSVHPPGLRSLYICHRRHWRGSGLVNVMERHHSTLEVFSVLGDLGLHQQVVASMASLDFARLHTFLLDMSDGAAETLDYNVNMSEFLRRSRCLRHVTLIKASADDTVLLDGLRLLPSLEELVLNDCKYLTEQAMLQFFSGQQNRQRLSHLVLKNTAALTDDVFEEIGRSCTGLKSLTIHNNKTCTLSGLRRFMCVHTTRLLSLEVNCSTKNDEDQLESVLDQMDAHAERWQFGYRPQNRQCYQVVFTHLTWWPKRDQLIHALYKEKS